jgi:DNA-binding transcriptional MocR family regulator
MAGAAAMIRGQLEEDDPLQAEAEFIALWNQGLEITEIAQRLGIPRGTVQSRAHRLQQRGLIQPRPKGGAYPRQKALARLDGSPTTPTPPTTPAPPAMTFVAVPDIQELLSLVKDLHTRVGALEQTRVPPALLASPAPPVTPATPAPPATERKDIQQWTVRLSKALIENLKAVGYERRIPQANSSRSSYGKP